MGQGEDAVARGGLSPRPPFWVVWGGGVWAAPARPVDTPGFIAYTTRRGASTGRRPAATLRVGASYPAAAALPPAGPAAPWRKPND